MSENANAIRILVVDDHPVVREGVDALVRRQPGMLIVETDEMDPYSGAELVDPEGNMWFGTTTGLHRFFYSPLTKQGPPHGSPVALAPGDDGAVWIARGSRPYLYLYRVSDGKAETILKLTSEFLNFLYRAPDKALWLGGHGSIWRLSGRNLVRIVRPPELAKLTPFMQAITQEQHGGMWVSFGRAPYRLADGVWTSYGGRTDLPKARVDTEFPLSCCFASREVTEKVTQNCPT